MPQCSTCVPWVQAGLLAALMLGACADNSYRASNQQRVKPDGLSVMITGAKSEAEAQPLADDYCHTLGRTARFKGMMQYRARRETSKAASFECLPEAIPADTNAREQSLSSVQPRDLVMRVRASSADRSITNLANPSAVAHQSALI